MTFSRTTCGAVAVSAAFVLGVLPATAVPALAGPAVPALRTPGQGERPLGLAHAPNARDIGGYPVQGGGRVAFGQVLRADSLAKLDEAEQQKLVTLGVTQVVDFRSPAETSRDPDRLPASINRIERPVFNPADDFYLFMARLIQGGPAAQQAALGDGKGVQYMRDYYRWLVTDASARAQFGATLAGIATATGPLLYHCTAGKDRTGWMTAILLSALRVPKGLIVQDFLDSNDHLAASNTALLDALVQQGLVTDRALWTPILGVQEDFLAAAFDQVKQSYGSMDAYLTDGLGVSTAQLDAVRAELVTAK
ncbi:tyrosine-protein phosphatase [Nocardia fluminea]|uniref:tyrosine-protein phosphatase n=1 Tax=Nocardia fluminea TaxID=134984 RepID=UPI003442AA68